MIIANPIERARQAAGKDGKPASQTALAAILGVTQPAIFKAERAGRVSVELAMEIDRKLGIPRHEMRPDVWPAPAENAA